MTSLALNNWAQVFATLYLSDIHEEPMTSMVLINNFKYVLKNFNLKIFKESMERKIDLFNIYRQCCSAYTFL